MPADIYVKAKPPETYCARCQQNFLHNQDRIAIYVSANKWTYYCFDCVVVNYRVKGAISQEVKNKLDRDFCIFLQNNFDWIMEQEGKAEGA